MTPEVTCTGMAKGALPHPWLMVIFRAAGDLVRHLLIALLYALGC
jgi:hypothetical protein